MHPMFVKLFLEPDPADPLADDEGKRRSVARSRRARTRTAVRVPPRDRGRQPRR